MYEYIFLNYTQYFAAWYGAKCEVLAPHRPSSYDEPKSTVTAVYEPYNRGSDSKKERERDREEGEGNSNKSEYNTNRI